MGDNLGDNFSRSPLVLRTATSGPGFLRGMYLSVVDRKKFRDEAQSAYESVLPDPGSRLLTWTWPRWIPLEETARGFKRFEWLERELKRSKFPTMCCSH